VKQLIVVVVWDMEAVCFLLQLDMHAHD